VSNDRFPANTHERALDKLTMVAQMLAEEMSRSLRFEEGEVLDGTMTLALRKGKGISFDATTGELEFYDVQDVLDAATDAAASAAEAAESAALALVGAGLPIAIDGLTGGTVGMLDAVAAASLPVGTIVRAPLNRPFLYRLRTGTDVEAPPRIVRPDDYTTKVWELEAARPTIQLGNLAAGGSGGTFNAFGDSQTYGTAVTSKWYSDGARALAAYRWPDMVANLVNHPLTINNYGVASSRAGWRDSANRYDQESHFNKLGRNIAYNWTGTVAALPNWNSTGGGDYGDDYLQMLRRANEAFIARALIDDYCAVTHLGWTRASSVDNSTPSWTSTGSSSGFGGGVAGDKGDTSNAFSAGAIIQRYRQILTGTQYFEFTLTDKKAVGIFGETVTSAVTGGPFTVSLNGTVLGTYTMSISGQADSYPFVVWLENLPSSAVIRIDNVSGENWFLAAGYVERGTASLNQKRCVIFGTTSGNTYNHLVSDYPKVLARNARDAAFASGAFARLGYPVYFANAFANWDQTTDQELDDLSHLNAWGNWSVATAMIAAQMVPGISTLENIIEV
jgi:hypothetical protein